VFRNAIHLLGCLGDQTLLSPLTVIKATVCDILISDTKIFIKQQLQKLLKNKTLNRIWVKKQLQDWKRIQFHASSRTKCLEKMSFLQHQKVTFWLLVQIAPENPLFGWKLKIPLITKIVETFWVAKSCPFFKHYCWYKCRFFTVLLPKNTTFQINYFRVIFCEFNYSIVPRHCTVNSLKNAPICKITLGL
jgi:hypothetical protein